MRSLLLHGGWDTIAFALLYQAMLILLPLFATYLLGRAILKRMRKNR